MNIAFEYAPIVKNTTFQINPGLWINPDAPGSIQLAVKDDKYYFGEAKLTYKKAAEKSTDHGTAYYRKSIGSDVKYPKIEDPTITKTKEFLLYL